MKPNLKYGLLVAATGILLSLISFILGIDKTDTGQYIGWLNIPITILALVYAIKEIRNAGGGFISFGSCFRTGMGVVFISTLITAAYTWLYMSVINPGIKDFILQKQTEKFEEQGMSEEQMEQALAMVEKFSTPLMSSFWVLIMGLLFGAIIVLIISAIMKKNDPNAIT